MKERVQAARELRENAAELAASRPRVRHRNNGEELVFRDEGNKPTYLMSFTKGLPHDETTGLVKEGYEQLVTGIRSGSQFDFDKIPPGDKTNNFRGWESAGAGLTFDLEGPDAQAVTMPPAPKLGSDELTAEIAEVYCMALLRDQPFSSISPEASSNAQTLDFVSSLVSLPWFNGDLLGKRSLEEQGRLRDRLDHNGQFDKSRLFRGQTPGEQIGPYLSQFLLIGNQAHGDLGTLKDGFVRYGSIRIDQRVQVADTCDYMTTWKDWLAVQNGVKPALEKYLADVNGKPVYRPILTPRDMATYVHYDALYEAYLNACLIMMGLGLKFDPALPFDQEDQYDKQQGFAQFGGPHILSLVCEVATRALKAVRYQKYNVHRRLRPEALAGRIHYSKNNTKDSKFAAVQSAFGNQLDTILDAVYTNHKSYLLPMAFPEGSPMHPSYGAGHGTVAGACVTILKAFFDHGQILTDSTGNICYESVADKGDGVKLKKWNKPVALTVEGELNKLAGNIAIARNWAGVHYYSDYIESMRLGEQIAIGILEEQKLTYGETFAMTVPLFDGGLIQI
jgi:hypothetical protein